MVNGIDTFKTWFRDYQDNYIVIGGAACDAAISDAGFTPRATKDIDIILVIEALSDTFVSHFWDYVRAAGYKRSEQEMGKRNAYRFLDPTDSHFPKQVELFSRKPDALAIPPDLHITPIPVEEGLSSLSAILLNDDYYRFTMQHSYIDDDIHYANVEALICLKSYAYLRNKQLKNEGVNIHSVDIDKHKNDVFRLLPLLRQDNAITLPEGIHVDLQAFAAEMKGNLPSQQMLNDAGFLGITPEGLYHNMLTIFQL